MHSSLARRALGNLVPPKIASPASVVGVMDLSHARMVLGVLNNVSYRSPHTVRRIWRKYGDCCRLLFEAAEGARHCLRFFWYQIPIL